MNPFKPDDPSTPHAPVINIAGPTMTTHKPKANDVAPSDKLAAYDRAVARRAQLLQRLLMNARDATRSLEEELLVTVDAEVNDARVALGLAQPMTMRPLVSGPDCFPGIEGIYEDIYQHAATVRQAVQQTPWPPPSTPPQPTPPSVPLGGIAGSVHAPVVPLKTGNGTPTPPAPSAHVEPDLTPTRWVHGCVVDVLTGEPIAGVTVEMTIHPWWADGGTGNTAVTDEDGTFRFDNLPPCLIMINVEGIPDVIHEHLHGVTPGSGVSPTYRVPRPSVEPSPTPVITETPAGDDAVPF